ncbi:hypothetical protein B8W95_14010, partial [Staphylococcus pasteuri]
MVEATPEAAWSCVAKSDAATPEAPAFVPPPTGTPADGGCQDWGDELEIRVRSVPIERRHLV